MTAVASSPIAGVSANREATLETVYPSVAMTIFGKLIAAILGPVAGIPFVPVRMLAYLILGAAVAPLAFLGYVLLKITGKCYEVTNRSVSEKGVIGSNKTKEVSLNDIASVQVVVRDGYDFHHVGDVELLNAQGNAILTIPAISSPQRLAHVIEEAREARLQSDRSLKQIQSRG